LGGSLREELIQRGWSRELRRMWGSLGVSPERLLNEG